MNEYKNLPEDWEWKKLNEICTVVTDGTHKTPKYRNTGIPFISIANIRPFSPITFEKYRKYISNEEHVELSRRSKVEKGDILFPRIGTLGYAKIVDWDFEVSIFVGLGLAKPNKNVVLSKYLEYFMNTQFVNNYSRNYANGSGRLTLPLAASRLLPVPIPPILIQQKIVSKIEEIFSELEKGIENLKLAQQQLKTYRQSVLKWAFEGKSTDGKGLWKNERLGDIANAIDPQPSHRTPPIDKNGIPFISIKDFDAELDLIDFSNARRVSKKVLNEHLKRYTLETGDFVIGKIGTIGKPVRIVLPQNYTLSANIVLIQPRKVVKTYLYYFFQSSLIQKKFISGMNATTQAAFGIQKMRELRIDLPEEFEQNKIIQAIERRLSVADKMGESITQSLQQLITLRQSILKNAFEGKLVK